MPYGPHKITRVRQVAIPGELLRAVGLELGDNVHFRLSESDPYVIEIVPSDIVARRYQAGAESETLERLSQPSALESYCQDLWIKIFKLLPARCSRRVVQ